jgi:hypothetical protein
MHLYLSHSFIGLCEREAMEKKDHVRKDTWAFPAIFFLSVQRLVVTLVGQCSAINKIVRI